MMTSTLTVWGLLLATPGAVDTQFVQVHPEPIDGLGWRRSVGQWRAVVLLHGLQPHPFDDSKVAQSALRDWQKPGSTLVTALTHHADVFAFAYGQNVALEEIAAEPALRIGIARLRKLGYQEVVLIGHSAGGLVARQFVEDHPTAGVTKVIQVCSPNGGSSWSKLAIGVRHSQEAFMRSLTKEGRQMCLKQRSGKRIPADVEFVCVVGMGAGFGDGVVSCQCQWTEDLQAQGIPAVPLGTTHFRAMRSPECAEKLAELVREPQRRWDAARVSGVRRQLLGRSARSVSP
jgi:pimeloyl-ACP methyl ester carboxylesterase